MARLRIAFNLSLSFSDLCHAPCTAQGVYLDACTRFVIAVGTCPVSDGKNCGGYACGNSLDEKSAVNAYLPGCPPTRIPNNITDLGRWLPFPVRRRRSHCSVPPRNNLQSFPSQDRYRDGGDSVLGNTSADDTTGTLYSCLPIISPVLNNSRALTLNRTISASKLPTIHMQRVNGFDITMSRGTQQMLPEMQNFLPTWAQLAMVLFCNTPDIQQPKAGHNTRHFGRHRQEKARCIRVPSRGVPCKNYRVIRQLDRAPTSKNIFSPPLVQSLRLCCNRPMPPYRIVEINIHKQHRRACRQSAPLFIERQPAFTVCPNEI